MKFNFTEQLDIKDCGPTCVKMISAYYGREYPLEYLRSLSYIGKNGVSLRGISNAAEKIGFKTLGGRISFDQLADSAILPCIIHWNQEHFVVVYKIKKKKKDSVIYIADPGIGLLKYNEDEFLKYWCSTRSKDSDKGIVLLLEPTDDFFNNEEYQTEKRKTGSIAFLSRYFKKYKKYFINIIYSLAFTGIISLAFPFLTQSIVDIGIKNKDITFIWLILLGQLMLLTGRTFIEFIRRRVLLHISSRINISLVSDFFIKLLKLPMSFFDSKLVGDLLQRIEDNDRIEEFLTSQSLNLIFSTFNILILGTVLLYYNFQIFIIFILFSIFYGIWIIGFLKKRKKLDYKRFELQSYNKSKTIQLINGIQEIKLQGAELRKRWEWEDSRVDLFYMNVKYLTLQQYQEAGSILINEVKNILITVISATAVVSGDLTLGMMLSIQYIIGQLNSPIEQIMGFIYKWQDVTISLERMKEIYTIPKEDGDEREIKSLSTLVNKDIYIKDLNFRFGGHYSKNVLSNINLNIPEGKITAIVGHSGSGKTTLIKLLLGSYIAKEGKILIGKKNLNKFNIKWWRSQCGAVMQDGYIFSDTIARNIAVSDEFINEELLAKAAKIANIHDFIMSLPLSYNTVIGHEGQGISQGQKQRILIARAVYKNPQFIFLDEATNSLDADNEKAIIENLNEFYKGKTVVIVAHRLSTVKNADQIIVLNDGTIIERGTHYELVRKKGFYHNLVKNQLELGA